MSTTYTDLYETKFPDEIDNWDRFLDPTIQTISAITQYQQYYDQGNFELANSVLENNPTLKRIIVNASTINKMLDGIVAIERFYLNDVQTYLQNIIQLKGEWSASTKYPKYSVVTYTYHSDQEAYLCLSNDCPIGTLPTDTNYWTPWTAKGEKGESGTGLTPRGVYSATVDYYKDDMVAYNNALWAAVEDNFGQVPNTSSSSWILLLEFSGDYLMFNNANSTLTSTTIQDAILELDNRIKIIKNVTIPKSGFINNVYTYRDNSVLSYYSPDVRFNKDSRPIAIKANITVESFDGYLTFTAKKIPTADLTAEVIIMTRT